MRMYLPSWIYFVLNSLKANIGGLRQKPESFYDQRYYSEAIFEFKAFDGVKRYVRFRMMPADGRPETGLLSEEVQQHPWWGVETYENPSLLILNPILIEYLKLQPSFVSSWASSISCLVKP